MLTILNRWRKRLNKATKWKESLHRKHRLAFVLNMNPYNISSA